MKMLLRLAACGFAVACSGAASTPFDREAQAVREWAIPKGVAIAPVRESATPSHRAVGWSFVVDDWSSYARGVIASCTNGWRTTSTSSSVTCVRSRDGDLFFVEATKGTDMGVVVMFTVLPD